MPLIFLVGVVLVGERARSDEVEDEEGGEEEVRGTDEDLFFTLPGGARLCLFPLPASLSSVFLSLAKGVKPGFFV